MIDIPAVALWVFWLSVVTFFGSLIVIPIIIVRMPHDYFTRTSPSSGSWRVRHPLVRMLVLVVKNALGAILLVAGLVMLFTPGQGILAALIGITLMDVPGKRTLERRVISLPAVHRTLNRIRERAGRLPLELPREATRQENAQAKRNAP